MTFAKTPVILAERENGLPMLNSAAAEGFDAGVIFRRRWMCQALADSQPPSLKSEKATIPFFIMDIMEALMSILR